jgi:hypothetical protein
VPSTVRQASGLLVDVATGSNLFVDLDGEPGVADLCCDPLWMPAGDRGEGSPDAPQRVRGTREGPDGLARYIDQQAIPELMRLADEPPERASIRVGSRFAKPIVKANEWDTEPNKHTGGETAFRHAHKNRAFAGHLESRRGDSNP